jgi:hypothetical protein
VSVVGAIVARESLQKQAASQSTQGSQLIKRNTTTQLPVHVGLHTVLARYPPPQSSSGKDIKEAEEEEQEEKEVEEEVKSELQESDEDLNKEDNKDENTELVDPTIKREPREPLKEKRGFQTASGRIVYLTRGTTKALAATRVA